MNVEINTTGLDFYCSKVELRNLLTETRKLGYKEGLREGKGKSKYISQNAARKELGASRLKHWMNDGIISFKTNGEGKNSRKYFEYSKLLELDSSEKIKIRKVYLKSKISPQSL